jgi:hypothetical protein
VRGVIYCDNCRGANTESSPAGAAALLLSTSVKSGQLGLGQSNLTKTYRQATGATEDGVTSEFLWSLCTGIRDAFLRIVYGNLELLAALCENAPKEIEIKWWEILVRPSKRKRKKTINNLNRSNHSKWKFRLLFEVLLAGTCGMFIWFLFVRILTLIGVTHVALSIVPALLFSLWMLSGATTRIPRPEVIQLQDCFDAELVLGGGGFVGGALSGSLIGSHVGLALGPLGAIAGTLPGALLGGLIGWLGGTNVATFCKPRDAASGSESTGVKAGATGLVAGLASGAWVGSGIGVALGPIGAIAGTIPGAAIGGLIGFLFGSRIARV